MATNMPMMSSTIKSSVRVKPLGLSDGFMALNSALTLSGVSVGFVAGHYLAKVKGMVILEWIKRRIIIFVQIGRVHG